MLEISANGAGVIAQVLPVLVLILVIERRVLGPQTRSTVFFAKVGKAALSISFGLAIILGFLAETACIAAVSGDQKLTGISSLGVSAYLLFIGTLVTLTLLDLADASLTGIDEYRARITRIEKSELIRTRAKRVTKLGKHEQPKIKNTPQK